MICKNCGNNVEGEYCTQCGARISDDIAAVQSHGQQQCANPFDSAVQSKFTGGAFGLFFVRFFVLFVSTITLFLAFPAMMCFYYKWVASHTEINGKKMYFDGNGLQLFGKYLLWSFLTVITLGIYSFFLVIKMKKWITSHTHYVDLANNEESKSKFTGGTFKLFFVRLWAVIVTIITLSFGAYWAKCFVERWKAKHTIIDGYRQSFDGKASQLFGKCVLWGFLTVITLGIYSFWFMTNYKKWIVSHTNGRERVSIDTAVTETAKNNSDVKAAVVFEKAKSQKTADIVENEINKEKADLIDSEDIQLLEKSYGKEVIVIDVPQKQETTLTDEEKKARRKAKIQKFNEASKERCKSFIKAFPRPNLSIILYCLPIIISFVGAILLYICMSGPATRDFGSLSLYDLVQWEIAVSEVGFIKVCLGLLVTFSVLQGLVLLYNLLTHKNPKVSVISFKTMFTMLSVLISFMLFVAYCVAAGTVNANEIGVGAGLVFCIIFALLLLGGNVASELISILKMKSADGLEDCTFKEYFADIKSRFVNLAENIKQKRLARQEAIYNDESVLHVQKQTVDKDAYKVGFAIDRVNIGLRKTKAIGVKIMFALWLCVTIALAITDILMFNEDINIQHIMHFVFTVFVFFPSILVVLGMLIKKNKLLSKYDKISQASTLNTIKEKSAITKQILFISIVGCALSILFFIMYSYIARQNYLENGGYKGSILYFSNRYVNNLFFFATFGSIAPYIVLTFNMIAVYLYIYYITVNVIRNREYKTIIDALKNDMEEDQEIGVKYAYYKNALREHELVMQKRICVSDSDGKMIIHKNIKLKNIIVYLTVAAVALIGTLFSGAITNHYNTDITNEENIAIVYNLVKKNQELDCVEKYLGVPDVQEGGRYIYYSSQYKRYEKKVATLQAKEEDLFEKIMDSEDETKIEKYMQQIETIEKEIESFNKGYKLQVGLNEVVLLYGDKDESSIESYLIVGYGGKEVKSINVSVSINQLFDKDFVLDYGDFSEFITVNNKYVNTYIISSKVESAIQNYIMTLKSKNGSIAKFGLINSEEEKNYNVNKIVQDTDGNIQAEILVDSPLGGEFAFYMPIEIEVE